MAKLWSARRIHFWTALIAGLFVTLWVVTGLVMMRPIPSPGGMVNSPVTNGSLADAVVSVGDAVTSVGGDLATVRNVRIELVGDWWTYQFRTASGNHIVNTATGNSIVIDADIARDLASRWMKEEHKATRVTQVIQHDVWYTRGRLPMYRVKFDNGTVGHVHPVTGQVQLADRRTLVRGYFASLHTFTTFRMIVRMGGAFPLLVLVSVLTIIVIGTGYLIGYPLLRISVRNRRAGA